MEQLAYQRCAANTFNQARTSDGLYSTEEKRVT
jgi:hypothetical protein